MFKRPLGLLLFFEGPLKGLSCLKDLDMVFYCLEDLKEVFYV